MNSFNTKTITDALKKHDYPFFKGDYNLNIIGVRSHDTDANTFNDVIVVLYELDKKQVMHVFPATTDPGLFYRENPLNLDGTAIVVPGHYRGVWQIGPHQAKYNALVQRKPMKVYRDNDSDTALDMAETSIDEGLFGINLHRAGVNNISLQVDKWSAGCQVLADPCDFDLLMALAKKSASMYGPSFSYTLLTEEQL